MTKKLLTEKEVAAQYGIPLKRLQTDRRTGGGIPFVKLTKSIFYREEDIEKFLKSHTRTQTKEPIESKENKENASYLSPDALPTIDEEFEDLDMEKILSEIV